MTKLTTKIAAIALALMAAIPSDACWYRKTNYNDYIFTVNNAERHTSLVKTIDAGSQKVNSIEYTEENYMVVDLPITCTMKLTSETPITITDDQQPGSRINDNARAVPVDAKLQYRVLPAGEWVTVSEFSIDSGRLPNSYPPAPYLGRNNISPKGLKAGDKIMIRLYVTDNAGWQSGDLASKCDEGSYNGQPVYLNKTISYKMTNIVEPNVDMGGGWYPHYVVVVEYSGYTRPVQ